MTQQASQASPQPWRHRRIWLDPACFGQLHHPPHTTPEDIEALAVWVNAGRPVVGRASGACDVSFPEGLAPLGLTLLPLARKRRLAFAAPRDAVLRTSPPLSVAEVLAVLPHAHRKTAESVIRISGPLHVTSHVYGSAFWSHASGQACMTDSSDLDLVFVSPTRQHTMSLLDQLTALDSQSPIRLDGELQLADGAAVSWRELQKRPPSVLVKTDRGPQLRVCAEVWSNWP